jgi:hypothetical protein
VLSEEGPSSKFAGLTQLSHLGGARYARPSSRESLKAGVRDTFAICGGLRGDGIVSEPAGTAPRRPALAGDTLVKPHTSPARTLKGART